MTGTQALKGAKGLPAHSFLLWVSLTSSEHLHEHHINFREHLWTLMTFIGPQAFSWAIVSVSITFNRDLTTVA